MEKDTLKLLGKVLRKSLPLKDFRERGRRSANWSGGNEGL